MNDVELHGVRITEVHTLSGPIMFRVEVLWYPSTGWRTDGVFPTQRQARKRVAELQDGLDAGEGERVVWEWRINQNAAIPRQAIPVD